MTSAIIAALLCPVFAVLCCLSSGQHPHQHPHRNSAEGTRGVGVDQFHNRSTSL